jgi:outer membrane protein assembly factor BamD (BamD/ComL family)
MPTKTDFLEQDLADRERRITFLSDALKRAERQMRRAGLTRQAQQAKQILEGNYTSLNGSN